MVKKGKNKHAQIIGQIFVFILAGLVLVLVITYGYKAIKHFTARSEEVALVDFQNDFIAAVEGVKYDFGSVRKTELRLPTNVLGLCVVNIDNCPSSTPLLIFPGKTISLDWMRDACLTGSANSFLIPRFDLLIQDVVVDSDFVCVPNIDGRVILRLEGLGKKAKVSAW